MCPWTIKQPASIKYNLFNTQIKQNIETYYMEFDLLMGIAILDYGAHLFVMTTTGK